MKKILILTSERTGTGHKSSANAIEKKLKELNCDAKQINCFEMMGEIGRKMEEKHIGLTIKHPFVWKIAHTYSQWFPNLGVHFPIYEKSKKALLKEIKEYNPDLIISVHCMFTKAISKLIKENNLNIPFMVNVIDLVNPPRVWRDKSADMVFLPTNEVKEEYLKIGFKEEQLVVSGFPIREDIIKLSEPKKIDGKLNILMVNPSVNLKKNLKFVKELSKMDANIKVVCGRDEKLYEALMEQKNATGVGMNNVEVFGFVTNMNELLKECHILLTKAGPNMLLEGTRSGSAVIVTGHVLGQEARNYEYITKNGYGVKCEDPNKIYEVVTDMVNSGTINTYLKNTLKSDCNDGAKIIAENIVKYLEK